MIIAVLIILVFGLAYWLLMSPHSQVLGKFPYRKVGETIKVIALTFDDGPNEPYTSQIVDFLNAENIKATFFQVAKAVEKYPNVSQKILKSGHVIGNHSLSHKFSNNLIKPSFKAEIEQSQAIFNKILGVKPALYRPPWLFRTPMLFRTLKMKGLSPVSGVFCNNREVAQINAQSIAKTAVKRAKPGAILIFHDGYDGKGAARDQTVESVKLSVQTLKSAGYKFVTVSELLELKPYQ